jgi:transposase
MERYVGLDAHSKNSVFVIQDQEGRVQGEGKVPTGREGFQQMRDRYGLETETGVALESGTVAFFVADCLQELGLRPVVIDAREVRVKASRPLQKSDRRDARELCEGLRRGIYRSIVSVPPVPIRELREALGRRRHFVNTKTAQVNAVKRLLRSAGQGKRARSLQVESGWQTLLETLSDAPRLRSFAAQHFAVWQVVHQQVRALEADIQELSRPWKTELSRLMTTPGVGTIVASTVLAVLFDADRFPSAKHAASYVGLVPSTDQSGDREHYGRITRRGSSELRAMLCEAAHHARRPTHPLNPYFSRLCARRGYRMATVAVAHRLCRILFAMLRDGTTFTAEKAGVEAGTFQKVSVRKYRLRATA